MEYTEQYYKNRPLEQKHFLEIPMWIECFNPEKVLDIGCGHGMRVYAFNYYSVDCYGFDFKEAIESTPYEEIKEKIWAEDLLNYNAFEKYDLVIVYDVLEHLNESDLDLALMNIQRASAKNILFSIPFKEDPNLHLDKTHKIFKTKEWWIWRLSKYFNIEEAPNYFLFSNQILIGRIKDEI